MLKKEMDNLDIEDDECGSMSNHEGECWTNWFSSRELEHLRSFENLDELDIQIEREKDLLSQKLWHSFQNAASSVAQLYKDRENGASLWSPFQNSATSVTTLYKDCTDSQKKFLELGYQSGLLRRNKELLAWVKKRKRNIRREDLLGFLSHLNLPYGHHRSRQRLTIPQESTSNSNVSTGVRTPPHLSRQPDAQESNEGDGNLQTFRDALAFSVGIRNSPQHPGTNSNNARRNGPSNKVGSSHLNSNSNQSLAELNAFITEEFTRHVESRKRLSSSTDVIMGSPTHKRSKHS